jgi:hypothetical protein
VSPLPDTDRERPPGKRPGTHDILVSELPGSETMSAIDIRCEVAAAGWRCRVSVSDAGGTSDHDVTIDELASFVPPVPHDPDLADIERLVHETFLFLLEREPRTSILRAFTLSDVSRYFPDYPDAVRVRLAD